MMGSDGAASATVAKCSSDAVLVGAQERAVVGRHEHQHVERRGSRRRRARSAAIRVEKWLQVTITGTRPARGQSARSSRALRSSSGEQELLRVVSQDADAVDALVDHAIEHPALAVEIEIARCHETASARSAPRPGSACHWTP